MASDSSDPLPACSTHAEPMRREGALRRFKALMAVQRAVENALARVASAPVDRAAAEDTRLVAQYLSDWEALIAIADETPLSEPEWERARADVLEFIERADRALQRATGFDVGDESTP